MPARYAALAASLSIAVIAAPTLAIAQDTTPRAARTPSELELRSSGTIAFMQSRPLGELGQHIGFGYGVNGAYLVRLDRAGFLSLRADAGFAEYGSESKHVPLSPTIGGRITVKLSTDNNVVPISIGPQLTWPRGKVRPYVHAGIGGQFFFTQSHVQGTSSDEEFASTTNQSDFTGAWVTGGGIYVPLSEKRTKVLLDVGAQYYGGGRATYLRPGSIADVTNTQISISPLESSTHMLLVRVGVKVGL